MKKVVMMFVMASFLVCIVACGGKKADAGATDEASTTESAAPADADNDYLVKYEEYVNKILPLYEKLAAGDAAAAQELGTITQEYAPFLQELGTKQGEFTEAQIAKFTELAQKLSDAAQKAFPQ